MEDTIELKFKEPYYQGDSIGTKCILNKEQAIDIIKNCFFYDRKEEYESALRFCNDEGKTFVYQNNITEVYDYVFVSTYDGKMHKSDKAMWIPVNRKVIIDNDKLYIEDKEQ